MATEDWVTVVTEGAPGYRGTKPPAWEGGDGGKRQAPQLPVLEPKRKPQTCFFPQILEKSAKVPQANDRFLKGRVFTHRLTPAFRQQVRPPLPGKTLGLALRRGSSWLLWDPASPRMGPPQKRCLRSPRTAGSTWLRGGCRWG